jgi:hypothetical protein
MQTRFHIRYVPSGFFFFIYFPHIQKVHVHISRWLDQIYQGLVIISVLINVIDCFTIEPSVSRSYSCSTLEWKRNCDWHQIVKGKRGVELRTVGKTIALFVSKKVLGNSTIDVTIDAVLYFTETKSNGSLFLFKFLWRKMYLHFLWMLIVNCYNSLLNFISFANYCTRELRASNCMRSVLLEALRRIPSVHYSSSSLIVECISYDFIRTAPHRLKCFSLYQC